jgi:DNA-binding NtrC family response regulator
VRKPLQEKSLEASIKHLMHGATWRNPRFDKDKEDAEWVAEDAFFAASSSVMRKLRSQLVILAQMDVPVLITGESGCGQEIAAQLIHRLSARPGSRLITINCGAFSEQVLEIELFKRGAEAAGSSLPSQPGNMELSQRGTVFLADLSEMSLPLQAKLLLMLREKQIWPVGASSARDVDVRLVASLEMEPQAAIFQKKLLADLYYHLSAFTVPIPPLRERTDELLFLLDCSMRRLSVQYSLPARTFPLRLLNACQHYGWPGNLRELENFVKRYLVIGDEELALMELETARRIAGAQTGRLIETEATASGSVAAVDPVPDLKSLAHDAKGAAEKNAIAAALDKTRWNRKAAARLLRVSYRSLLYKIDQYHMSPPEYSTASSTHHGAKGNSHGG